MRQEQSGIGHSGEIRKIQPRGKGAHIDDFVLEKSIFNTVFEKDIRRVFIYKKAERLAKAIHLIEPAFTESASLRNRISAIAIGLVDAAILPTSGSRSALSRELLMLSSLLSMARTGGFLSSMNADLIANEAHNLLQEIAAYEEPRLPLDEAPTLSSIAKNMSSRETTHHVSPIAKKRASTHLAVPNTAAIELKGHIKDIDGDNIKDRRGAILSVIKNKGRASIKDISTLIRDVSEKTIQRELLALVTAGIVLKQGERRWSTYSVA